MHWHCIPWNMQSPEKFGIPGKFHIMQVCSPWQGAERGVVIKLCWTCRPPLQPPWIIFSRRSASTRPWESWQNLCQSTSPHLCRSRHLLGFVLAFIENCSCSVWVGVYNAIFQESVKLRIVSSEKVKFAKIPSRKCREKTFANMNVMKQWRGRGNLYDGAGEWVIVCYCSALNASEERGRLAAAADPLILSHLGQVASWVGFTMIMMVVMVGIMMVMVMVQLADNHCLSPWMRLLQPPTTPAV